MTGKIAIDAFGGDNCPEIEIEAAVSAARNGLRIILVGDEAKLRERLAKVGARERATIEIRHASEVITMEDIPSKAIRNKRDASMPVCFDLVRAGEADAVVSAGNSGMMLACGLFKFRRIRGVDRPAIVTCFPNPKDVTVLLDMGANVDCKPINLVQFAVMGAVYARVEHGKRRPVVGLLSNGSEASKGTDLTRAAHRLLRAHPSEVFEYAGYIEGKDLFAGEIDVVVTDGFTGNVVLKTVEGTARLIVNLLREAVDASPMRAKLGARLMRPAFDQFKRKSDPDSYGGAPLLGVDGTAVICHGGASVRAMLNGIRLADRLAKRGTAPGLRDALGQHEALFAAAKAEESAG